MDLYLALGTNLGDRRENIRKALELLDARFGTSYKRLSSLHETKSIGFVGPDFLNCAVFYEIPEMAPEEILDATQAVEQEMGRGAHDAIFDENGNRIYDSRIIDIDILFIDNQQINTDRLTVPHPRMLQRDFVMAPLTEIIE